MSAVADAAQATVSRSRAQIKTLRHGLEGVEEEVRDRALALHAQLKTLFSCVQSLQASSPALTAPPLRCQRCQLSAPPLRRLRRSSAPPAAMRRLSLAAALHSAAPWASAAAHLRHRRAATRRACTAFCWRCCRCAANVISGLLGLPPAALTGWEWPFPAAASAGGMTAVGVCRASPESPTLWAW